MAQVLVDTYISLQFGWSKNKDGACAERTHFAFFWRKENSLRSSFLSVPFLNNHGGIAERSCFGKKIRKYFAFISFVRPRSCLQICSVCRKNVFCKGSTEIFCIILVSIDNFWKDSSFGVGWIFQYLKRANEHQFAEWKFFNITIIWWQQCSSKKVWRQQCFSKIYDGSNAFQKCIMSAMPFKNVWWQQYSSKMYEGSNAFQKCMMAAMPFKNVRWQQCSSKMYEVSNALQKCMMAAMPF